MFSGYGVDFILKPSNQYKMTNNDNLSDVVNFILEYFKVKQKRMNLHYEISKFSGYFVLQ